MVLSLTAPSYAPTVAPFPMSSRENQVRPAAPRREPKFPTRFDKAFPVYLEGERGVAAGIGRNITQSGMFVETREPFPLGSRVRVTFTSPGRGPEMVLEGEVRYQCFINYAREDRARAGMRAIGLRFVTPRGSESPPKGAVHGVIPWRTAPRDPRGRSGGSGGPVLPGRTDRRSRELVHNRNNCRPRPGRS